MDYNIIPWKARCKMKPMRILYAVALVASLALSGVFYYKYQLKGSKLNGYQGLGQRSSQAIKRINLELVQSKKELEDSLREVASLNKTIASLEKDKSNFKGRLQVLKEEREKLQVSIALLIEEKTLLEKKFQSLQELRKAIRIAKSEQRQRKKSQKIQQRLAKIEMLKAMDRIALQHGNLGYLVKDTKLTFRPTRITVELEPANKWSYREEDLAISQEGQ